jgi:hypothetical protein
VGKNGSADAAQYVPMQPIHEQRFHRSPDGSGTQVCFVIRDQCDIGRVAATMYVVRTTLREDARFDAEPLFNDLESQQTRRFHGGDALGQVSAAVCAADDSPNASFVTFGSQGMRQQRAKEPCRGAGDFFIEH